VSESFFDCVLNWLHEGYPQGVPHKDYFPLLALLKRTLSEEQVVKAAQTLLREGDTPITTEQIHRTIHEITEQEPNPEEIRQVAARLASVGWPLAATAG
jgi:Protein of unknown function (DUF3349)